MHFNSYSFNQKQKFCLLNILKICKNFASKCIEKNNILGTRYSSYVTSLQLGMSNFDSNLTSTWNRMINLSVSQTNREKFKALDII